MDAERKIVLNEVFTLLTDTDCLRNPETTPNGWEHHGETNELEANDTCLDIAQWAVNEQNKDKGTKLVFEKVNFCWNKVLTIGTIYAILLTAKENDISNKYLAIVFKVRIIGTKKLFLFYKIPIIQVRFFLTKISPA